MLYDVLSIVDADVLRIIIWIQVRVSCWWWRCHRSQSGRRVLGIRNEIVSLKVFQGTCSRVKHSWYEIQILLTPAKSTKCPSIVSCVFVAKDSFRSWQFKYLEVCCYGIDLWQSNVPTIRANYFEDLD